MVCSCKCTVSVICVQLNIYIIYMYYVLRCFAFALTGASTSIGWCSGLLFTPIQAIVNTGFCVQMVLRIYCYLIAMVYCFSFYQYKTVATLPSRSCLFSPTTPVLIVCISLLFITFRKILKYEKKILTIPMSRCHLHGQSLHR
jgi:hypothetical protein